MYSLKPFFYDDFHCIGKECSFTCCGGWGISVDKESYENVREEIKARTNLSYNEMLDRYIITLNENGMCPFCDKEQLCDVIKEWGEEELFPTCKVFPRVKYVTMDTEEYYLGLGCPAVVDFFKDRNEPLSFVLDFEGFDDLLNASDGERKEIEELYRYIKIDLFIRDSILDFLQNRAQPLWVRLFGAAYCLDKVKEQQNEETIYSIVEQALSMQFVDTLMCGLEAAQREEEKCFFCFRQLTTKFSDSIGRIAMDKAGSRAKGAELFQRSISISFEQYMAAYHEWRQDAGEGFEILMEHIISYEWMQYAMMSFTKYYMLDNYYMAAIEILLIKYFCIIYYAIYNEMSWDVIRFIIVLICRSVSNGRIGLEEKLDRLKADGILSVTNLYLMLHP